MALPEPKPGLVIHYAYLWRTEALRGLDEAAKERPSVVVTAVQREAGRLAVMVAPITHAPPMQGTTATEVPAATKQRLGLDHERSWVVTSDVNVFEWPGYDVRPVPGGARGFVYGYLDRGTIGRVQDQIRDLFRRRALQPTRRDDIA